MTDQFLVSNFKFHGYETKKKVTNSDYQNHEGIGNILKFSLLMKLGEVSQLR